MSPSALVLDVRHAARASLLRPQRAALVVATMAFGIGLSTALYSVVHGVLLAPLPWPESERLVRLAETRQGAVRGSPWSFTQRSYDAWAAEPSTLDALGAWRVRTQTLAGAGDAVRLRLASVTASLFPLLQSLPLVGRALEPADEHGPKVVVLSEGLWEERFGRDPGALGRALQLDGVAHRVVGVMPRGFAFPDRETRAWVALSLPPSESGDIALISAVGRLRRGVTPQQAEQEGTRRAAMAPPPGPVEMAVYGVRGAPVVRVRPLLDSLTAEVRPALLLMLCAVGALLLATAGNLAGLQAAAATARLRELAVRAAVGAGRGRLVRLLLVENALLGLAGGGLGLALAAAASRALPSLLPPGFPRGDAIAIDGAVAVVAVALSLATGLGVGLLPALIVRRIEPAALLGEGGRALGPAGTRVARLRTAILTAQVAVASVLLLGSLQLGRSFFAQLAADRGFEPAHLLVADLTLPGAVFGDEERGTLLATLLERLRALPTVEQAAIANLHPLSEGSAVAVFPVRPARPGEGASTIHADVRAVSTGYLEALGRRLVAGRFFEEPDSLEKRPVLVVNRTFAERYVGPDAVGTTLASYGSLPDRTIVGVIEDARPARLGEPRQPEVLAALPARPGLRMPQVSLLVRTRSAPGALAPTLRALMREQHPAFVANWIRPMDELLQDGLARPRLYSVLAGGFAACALLVVGVGLFGTLSYGVALRRREIGLRVALGARPGDVVSFVTRRVLVHAGIGLAAGLLASLAVGRWLRGTLYGVEPLDLFAGAAVAASIAAVLLASALVPARRAARIDPQAVLREG